MAKLNRGDVIKLVISCFLAVVLGIFGFALLFTDLGPGETLARRDLVTVLFNLLCGLLFGLVNPKSWPYSGILAWGGVLIALRGIFSGPSAWLDTLTVLGLAPLPALAGGYVGAWLRRRRAPRRLQVPPGNPKP